MSQRSSKYPWDISQQATAPPPIVPTAHDVLSGTHVVRRLLLLFLFAHRSSFLKTGRGVNMAQHPGNERFRALVNKRYDPNYCSQYSTNEKQAIAREIVKYIQSLDPPGRFLKRPGRSKNSRGLEGPWEELTEQGAIKRTCQALRDCNRQDRSGYAASVAVPQDVRQVEEMRLRTGLSNKEYAEQALAVKLRESNQAIIEPDKWNYDKLHPQAINISCDDMSPSLEHGASWLKKQRLDFDGRYIPTTTPTTAASSSGMLGETSLLDSANTSASSPPQSRSSDDHTDLLLHHKMPSSPAAAPFENLGSSFHNAFHPPHLNKLDINPESELDPLSLAASNNDEHFENHSFDGSDHDFGPPSLLHDPQDHHHSTEDIGGTFD